MPVSQLRAGMKGYGLTVFHGTKIERFGFVVLGLLPKYYMGQPLILVRLTGGPMTSRGAYLIQGMSGSPCYVNDRLIGAFSMGESGAKEPIGMLTPIQAMLEALDPKLPNRPLGISAAEFGVSSDDTASVGPGEAAAGPGFGPAAAPSSLFSTPSLATDSWPLIPGYGAMQFEPLATPLMVSGLSGRAFQMLANGMRPFRLAAMPAPGAIKEYKKPIALEPGAAVGVQLASGDIDITAVGTVTYRHGSQVVMFGHPFMQLGPTNFPLTTAYIHEVFPGLAVSHKIASPVKAVGTMLQDRPFSVAGRLGPLPPMIPLTCTVDDRSTGRKRLFHANVVNHPLLAPLLVPAVVDQAVFEAHPVPGDATAAVHTEVVTEGFGKIERDNDVFDAAAIDAASLEDLTQVLDLLTRNRFQRVPIKALNLRVTIEAKRRTAVVERIFVRQEKFEPGETVDVGVVLRPYRGESFTRKAQIKVPDYAANGRAVLMVSGGPVRAATAGVVVIGGSGGAQSSSAAAPAMSAGGTNASSVAQLLQQYLEKEKNNQLVTRIVFANPAVSVGGVTLSQFPSTLADVMRSAKSSSLRTDRDEVKSVLDTDWLVTGAQSLAITIERKDQSEKRSVESGTSKPAAPAPSSEPATSLSSRATALSVEEDDSQTAPAGPISPEPAAAFPPAHGRRGGATPPVPDELAGQVGGVNPKSKIQNPKSEEGAVKLEAPSPDAKLVGRPAVRWTQSSQEDFERGTMHGVGVSSAGDIRLAPRLRPLHETPEQFIWSVAARGGDGYAGTGSSGLIYRIETDGDANVFFKTGELEVHALARDRQGNLYAGTSPNGKVFRISPDGKGKLLFALNPDGEPLRVPAPPARFILSLAVAEDGTVYAGTGPDGRVYRITPDGNSTLFYQTPDQYVMSLLAAGDHLYAGTADSGLVYDIDRTGSARCIHDSDEKAITALARDKRGRLYAASAPKGIIYRIAPDGAVTTVWDKSKGAIYAMAAAPSGEIYAACANVIYRLGTDDKVTVLSDSKRAQFVALAVGEDGRLFAGSANVGTLYTLETGAIGTFESAVHDAKTIARWGQVRWVASIPEGARLEFETRSGYTPEPDATWSPWAPVQASTSGMHVASPPARFIQYRVKLSTGSDAQALKRSGVPEGALEHLAALTPETPKTEHRTPNTEHGMPAVSPILRQVVISYLPRNQAPSVTLAAPAAGEFWRGAHEIRWTGTDPDKDTLTYEVYFSSDNGKSWKRIGERVQPSAHPGSPAPQRASAPRPVDPQVVAKAMADNPALARLREDLVSSPELSEEDRREALRQADELIARMAADGEGEAPAPAADKSSTGGGAARPEPGTTRESSLRWDTTQVSDGTYQIKVVASDRVSNPSEPLTDEAISDPVMVANQAPRLVTFSHAIKIGADRKVRVAGIAGARVPLQGAQYRIDGGDWVAVLASDGIWDGQFEPWTFTTAALSSGKHRLELKLVDAAGNVTTQTVPVEVP